MGSSSRQRWAALLLMLVLAALALPFVLRERVPLPPMLQLSIPAAPVMPMPAVDPVVSEAELAQVQAKMAAAERDPFNAAMADAELAPAEGEIPLPSAWSVELATGLSQADAEALLGRLREADFRSYIRHNDAGWQVFAGPEIAPQAAEQTRDSLRLDPRFQLAGQLVPFQL
mgnify:CR=1 FL=1